MTSNGKHTLSLLVAVVGLSVSFVSLGRVVWIHGGQMAKLETKVDLLWKVVVEDALRKAAGDGLLRQSEPEVNDSVFAQMAKSADTLVTRTIWSLASGDSLPKNDVELIVHFISVVSWEKVIERSSHYELYVQDYLALCLAAIRQAHREGSLVFFTRLKIPIPVEDKK